MSRKNQAILTGLVTMQTFKFNFPQIMKIGHIWVCYFTTEMYVGYSIETEEYFFPQMVTLVTANKLHKLIALR